MSYIKYQHVERFGTDEVDNINIGECYIFPKLDGTNGQVWFEDGEIKAGSRRRELSEDKDNAGFLNEWVKSNESKLKALFEEFPHWRLHGEWLVPHSLKTYREDAWREFYIFDVSRLKDKEEIVHDGDSRLMYIHYEIYRPHLHNHGFNYLVPQSIISNPSYEQLIHECKANTFLIKDGKGCGEGIVIKNYDFKNKYNRQTWAKIVTNEFKETHKREMGPTEKNGPDLIEERIVDDLLTSAMVEKTYSKITSEKEGWKSSYIPQLLGRVWHDFVTEESWNIVKKYKNPKIDYKTLNHLCIQKVKQVKPELF